MQIQSKKAKVKKVSDENKDVKRKRRRRCGSCVGCLRDDCMECAFCLDQQKYGGVGVFKKVCKKRKCMSLIDDVKI